MTVARRLVPTFLALASLLAAAQPAPAAPVRDKRSRYEKSIDTLARAKRWGAATTRRREAAIAAQDEQAGRVNAFRRFQPSRLNSVATALGLRAYLMSRAERKAVGDIAGNLRGLNAMHGASPNRVVEVLDLSPPGKRGQIGGEKYLALDQHGKFVMVVGPYAPSTVSDDIGPWSSAGGTVLKLRAPKDAEIAAIPTRDLSAALEKLDRAIHRYSGELAPPPAIRFHHAAERLAD
jgi:hypothetical protein